MPASYTCRMAGWSSWPSASAFAKKPGAGRLIGVEIDPQAHPALEDLVVCLEEHAHPPRPRRCAPAGTGAPGPPGPLEGEQRLRAGQRSSPAPPLDPAGRGRTPPRSHHRRLRSGDWSVKNRLHAVPAQRRTRASRSASVAAAERAMASSAVAVGSAQTGAATAPPTRVSCWLPERRVSSSFIAAIDPPAEAARRATPRPAP